MKTILIISWVMLFLYLTANIVIGSYPTDKEAYDMKTIQELEKIKEERDKSILHKAQQTLLPIWRFNRFIYPMLILLCFVTSFVAWRNKSHNNQLNADQKPLT